MEHEWHLWWAWYPVHLLEGCDAAGPEGFRRWSWRSWVSYSIQWQGGWGNDEQMTEYDVPHRSTKWRKEWEVDLPDVSDMREKMEATWRLDPWHERPVSTEARDGLIRWTRERQKPRMWHYMIRFYRQLVLPRPDWRLPWR